MGVTGCISAFVVYYRDEVKLDSEGVKIDADAEIRH